MNKWVAIHFVFIATNLVVATKCLADGMFPQIPLAGIAVSSMFAFQYWEDTP